MATPTLTPTGDRPTPAPTGTATSILTATDTPTSTCPELAAWTCGDIGAALRPGGQALAGRECALRGTITGSGNGLGSAPDDFHYVWQPLTGSGLLSARLVAPLGTADAEAGIIMRQDTTAQAPFYLVAARGGAIMVQARDVGGTIQRSLLSLPGGAAFPLQLRVIRTAMSPLPGIDTYLTQVSVAGAWLPIVSSTVTLHTSGTVLRGLIVASGNPTVTIAAAFDSVCGS